MTPRCTACGTELQQATLDLDPAPDTGPARDRQRAEFDAQHMAAVGFCPNPDCPHHGRPGSAEDAGARV